MSTRTAVALATLLIAPAAHAARPITLSTAGQHPDVAVSPDGVGHLVWAEPKGTAHAPLACNLRPGAGTCAPTALTAPAGSTADYDAGGPYVFAPSASRELVLAARCCAADNAFEKVVYGSADSGASFASPTTIATDQGTGEGMSGQALFLPDGAVAGLSGDQIATINSAQSGGGHGAGIQIAPLAGPSVSEHQNLDVPTLTASLAAGQGNLFATFVEDTSATAYPYALLALHYSGSGDPNADWGGFEIVDSPIDPLRATNATGGPGGIWVLYGKVVAGQAVYVVSHRLATKWSPPTIVTDANPQDSAYLFEDGNGRLHLLWVDADGSLRYRYTTDNANAAWSRPQTLTPKNAGSFLSLRGATDPSGHGWAVWDSGPTGSIHALPLAPGQPLPTPSAATASGPGAAVGVKARPPHAAQLGGVAPMNMTTSCHTARFVKSVTTHALIVGTESQPGSSLDIGEVQAVPGGMVQVADGNHEFRPEALYSSVTAADGTQIDDDGGDNEEGASFSPFDSLDHVGIGRATGPDTGTVSLAGDIAFPLGTTLAGHRVDTSGPTFTYAYVLDIRGCVSRNTVTIVRGPGVLRTGVSQVSHSSVMTYAGCAARCKAVESMVAGGQTIARRTVRLPAHAVQWVPLSVRPTDRHLLRHGALPATLVTRVTVDGHTRTVRTHVRLHPK